MGYTCGQFSKGLKLAQLKYLVLDTKFFDQDFKDRLLSEFDDMYQPHCLLNVHDETVTEATFIVG